MRASSSPGSTTWCNVPPRTRTGPPRSRRPRSSGNWRTHAPSTSACTSPAPNSRLTEVFRHPVQVALKAIDQETWSRQHMVLPWVDDEFARHPERAQRLIHLLSTGERHVEVLVPAHEQRRRFDAIGVKESVGHFQPAI